jgi:hypothetical protein
MIQIPVLMPSYKCEYLHDIIQNFIFEASGNSSKHEPVLNKSVMKLNAGSTSASINYEQN